MCHKHTQKGLLFGQHLLKCLTERGGGVVAGELAVVADGDVAGLLGDDYGDGVGELGGAEGGAVAQAHLLRQIAVFRHGQDAAGGSDAVGLDDDRAVIGPQATRAGRNGGGEYHCYGQCQQHARHTRPAVQHGTDGL